SRSSGTLFSPPTDLPVLMHKPFKPNDFLPTAVQQAGRTPRLEAETQERDGSVETGRDKSAWETPWSSAGEAEPGWWKAFALDKDVRATRTPDRIIKKQSETNVVALSSGEAIDIVRLARAADRSCTEAIRRRLERLRNAAEPNSLGFSTFELETEGSPVVQSIHPAGGMVSVEEPPIPIERIEDVATASAANSADVYEHLETRLNGVDIANCEVVSDCSSTEQASLRHQGELLLPVAIEKARPVFSGFAFQSSLYKISVFFKPESSIDLSIEDDPHDGGPIITEDADSIDNQESLSGMSEWIEPEDVAIPEIGVLAPEQNAEEIDPCYLSLYSEEISSSLELIEISENADRSAFATANIGTLASDVSVSAGQAVVAQVINFPKVERTRNTGYELPDVQLLAEPPESEGPVLTEDILEERAGRVEKVIRDFGVKGEVIHVRPGPVVTLYELEPAPGVKSSRVIALSDDIARSMSAVSARVAVVPGRNAIGIELPNDTRETVYLREMLESEDFKGSTQKLPLCLGKTIGGEPVIADLARMPHLLVAGTTGSG
ncbi:FtsK/SpoIIIE family protein, partial [Microvirga guangxiensis]